MQGDHGSGFLLRQLSAKTIAFRRLAGEGLPDLGEISATGGDRGDEAPHRALRFLQLASCRGIGPRVLARAVRAFLVVLLHEERDGVRRKQLLLETREDPALQLSDGDRPCVVAGSGGSPASAGEPVVGVDRVAALAQPAPDQAGQQVLGAFAKREWTICPRAACILDALPERVVDDAEFGYFLPQQLGGRVGSREAVARVGIAHHANAVVDQAADIDRVVQDADHPRAVADDRRCPPLTAARRGDALFVEALRDRLRPPAVSIFGEDAANDRGLVLVDRASADGQLATLVQLPHDVVAIADSPGYEAALDAAALAAPDLLGHLLQLERVHRALQPDVQLVDLAGRQREDTRAGEGDALVDRRNVLLVAGEPILVFRQHDIESARRDVGEHRRHAGPPVVGARDGEVGEDLDDLPAFAIGAPATFADLILGRGFGLPVGREASVDCAAGHCRLRL